MGLPWEWDSNMSYKVNFVIVSEFDISQNIDSRCYLPIQIQTKIFLFFHPLSFANFILKPKISLQVIVWKHTYIFDNWFGLYILRVVRCKGYKTRIITLFESSSSLNILKFRKMRHWHWRKTHLILQTDIHIYKKILVLCKDTAKCKFYLDHESWRYENHTTCDRVINCLLYFHALKTIAPICKEISLVLYLFTELTLKRI